jgi:3'-phosphoadenosine 5'-phosphosulfate sulfotransferase (PAPS reductase)/FAD synthetase
MPSGVYPRISGDSLKSRLAALTDAQSEPLATKQQRAETAIAALAEHGQMAIMFSGGRDSYIVAKLAALYVPILVYCDTGLSSPKAAARVRELATDLRLDLKILMPEVPALEMWQTLGHYPIGPKRGHTFWKRDTPGLKTSPVQCCYHLKEKPAKQFIREEKIGSMLWGNRAADSNRRKLAVADFGMVQPPSTRWACWSATPIACWTDEDVQSFLGAETAQFENKSEDGCVLCCTDISRRDNQLTKTFIRDRAQFDAAILAGLGQQILRAQGYEADAEAVARILADQPHRFLRVKK